MAKKKAPKPVQRYVKFAWPISTYFPEALQNIAKQAGNDRALRREYTRLRDIAVKRIKRMNETEFGKTRFYREWEHKTPKLKELKSTSELTHALSELARFVMSPQTLIKGMEQYKKKQLESLQATGFEWVTAANVWEFMDFMDWLHTYDKNYYPSNTMDVLKEGLSMGKTQAELRAHFEAFHDTESETIPLFSEVKQQNGK